MAGPDTSPGRVAVAVMPLTVSEVWTPGTTVAFWLICTGAFVVTVALGASELMFPALGASTGVVGTGNRLGSFVDVGTALPWVEPLVAVPDAETVELADGLVVELEQPTSATKVTPATPTAARRRTGAVVNVCVTGSSPSWSSG